MVEGETRTFGAVRGASATLHVKFEQFLDDGKGWKRDLNELLRTIESRRWAAYLFGGAVREIFLWGRHSRPRDLDLVLDGRSFEEFQTLYASYTLGQNRFGGLKLRLRALMLDVWPLERTWAFAAHPGAGPWAKGKLKFEHLPRTTFLNIDAVAVRIGTSGGRHHAWVIQHGFFEAMRQKILDINFAENPYPDLSVVRSLYYADRFGFGISGRLTAYLRHHIREAGVPALIAAQRRHYGRVIYDESHLQWLSGVLGGHPAGEVQAGALFPPRVAQIPLSQQLQEHLWPQFPLARRHGDKARPCVGGSVVRKAAATTALEGVSSTDLARRSGMAQATEESSLQEDPWLWDFVAKTLVRQPQPRCPGERRRPSPAAAPARLPARRMLPSEEMDPQTASLCIPPGLDLPAGVLRSCGRRPLIYQVQERERFHLDYQPLLAAIHEAGGRLLCLCVRDHPPEVGVRFSSAGDGTRWIYRLPHSGLQHRADCPFWSAPVVTHTEGSVRENEDGTTSVRLNFGLGMAGHRSGPDVEQDEHGLRERVAGEKLDGYGPEALLRQLFLRGGLNVWRKGFRSENRVRSADGGKTNWWPSYQRLINARSTILPMGCRRADLLDRYVCISGQGALKALDYPVGTQFLAVGIIKGLDPNAKGGYRLVLDEWRGKTRSRFFISDALTAALLRQLRVPSGTADDMVNRREPIQPRAEERWWVALVAGVEGKTEQDAHYQVRRSGCLRTSGLAIPIESDEERLLQDELVRRGRDFQVPLFAGTVPGLPGRRPDFILEDTGAWPPPCVEVTGMAGNDRYEANHRRRKQDYGEAGVRMHSWNKEDSFDFLDEEGFWPPDRADARSVNVSVRVEA